MHVRYNKYILKYAKTQNSEVLHNSDTFYYAIFKIKLLFFHICQAFISLFCIFVFLILQIMSTVCLWIYKHKIAV